MSRNHVDLPEIEGFGGPFRSAPAGALEGRNFMTPDVWGFYRFELGGRVVYVEVSSGPALLGDGMNFGLTFRHADGSRVSAGPEWKDPSRLFGSFQEAAGYLRTRGWVREGRENG